jgi:hypothetical protein
MSTSPQIDKHLLEAVFRVAHEECGHTECEMLEPALSRAWEELRGDDTQPWQTVAAQVRATCQDRTQPN